MEATITESWDAFFTRIATRRAQNIAAADPVRRAELIAADSACAAIETASRAMFLRHTHCRTNRRLAFPSSPQTVALLEGGRA